MKTLAACRLRLIESANGSRALMYVPDEIVEMPDGQSFAYLGSTAHPLALSNDVSFPGALEALARTLRAIDDKKKGN